MTTGWQKCHQKRDQVCSIFTVIFLAHEVHYTIAFLIPKTSSIISSRERFQDNIIKPHDINMWALPRLLTKTMVSLSNAQQVVNYLSIIWASMQNCISLSAKNAYKQIMLV